MKRISTPIDKEIIKTLKKGDIVLLSGTMYTARDAAHKKMLDILRNTGEVPLKVKRYITPDLVTQAPRMCGSIGPTSSYRMDDYTPIF